MTADPDAASVAVFEGDKVLLIQRAVPPFQGYWSLPGGRLKSGETAEQAARRELAEEIGLVAGALTPVTEYLAGVDGRFRIAVFSTREVSGVLRRSNEVSDWRRLPLVELAGLQTTPGLAEIVAACRARLTDR